MVYIRGIHLYADEYNELHAFANKMGISRTWFQLEPDYHYDVICPFTIEAIEKYIEKQNKKLKK